MTIAQQETSLSVQSVPSTSQSLSRNSVISFSESSINDDEENELKIVEKKTTPDIKNNVTNCTDVQIVHNNTCVYKAPVTVNQTSCHDPLQNCKVSEMTSSIFFVAVFIILIVGASIIVFVRVFTMPDPIPRMIAVSTLPPETGYTNPIPSSIAVSTTFPPIQTLPPETGSTITEHELKFISHRDWEKQDWNIKSTKKFTANPVSYVVITETRTSPCFTIRDCVTKIKLIQFVQDIKDSNDSDVPYNFLVGGDGSIYEGRGWDLVAVNEMIHGSESIVIGLIGYFDNVQMLKKDQLNAVENLVKFGIDSGKIKADYELITEKAIFCSIDPVWKFCNITNTSMVKSF